MIGSRWLVFFFSSRRRHTRCGRDWSSDVCSSDLSRCWSPSAWSSRPRTKTSSRWRRRTSASGWSYSTWIFRSRRCRRPGASSPTTVARSPRNSPRCSAPRSGRTTATPAAHRNTSSNSSNASSPSPSKALCWPTNAPSAKPNATPSAAPEPNHPAADSGAAVACALAGDGEGGVAGWRFLDDVDLLDAGVGRPVANPVEHPLDAVLGSLEERLDGAVRPVANPAADPGLLSLPATTVPEEHALNESVHNDATADHPTVVPRPASKPDRSRHPRPACR